MIEPVLLTVAWIWGVNALFKEPFILYKVGEVLDTALPKWVSKPLFLCPPCMSSFHGTLMYIILFKVHDIPTWVIFCVCVCGINFLLKEFLYED